MSTNEIKSKVKELFENGEIDLFIGYEKGTRSPRPYFVNNIQEAENLIFDLDCQSNLAVYLTRKDLVGGKKVGIAASYYALNSILRLFAEYQLKQDNLIVFSVDSNNAIHQLKGIAEISNFFENAVIPSKAEDDEVLENLETMTSEERWQFWREELSKCFKCYACRSACPMCYCNKCIVEVNRPQWIDPWPTTQSNMEWQINRVMHMAGRCADCGQCGDACPMGIPVHLLAHKMVRAVKDNFGETSNDGSILSTFQPDDKEKFIL